MVLKSGRLVLCFILCQDCFLLIGRRLPGDPGGRTRRVRSTAVLSVALACFVLPECADETGAGEGFLRLFS